MGGEEGGVDSEMGVFTPFQTMQDFSFTFKTK